MSNTSNTPTTSEVTPFNFETQQVRIITRDGEPWFVAADVCRVLDIINPSDAIKRLDDDEVLTLDLTEGQLPGRGGARSLNIISESGLYALILRSDKPKAKPFRKWVTSEVLPTIRKTGRYEHPASKKSSGRQTQDEEIESIPGRRFRLEVGRWCMIELVQSPLYLNELGMEQPLINSRDVARHFERAHFPLLRQLRDNPALSRLEGKHFRWLEYYEPHFRRWILNFLMTRDGFTMLTHRWRLRDLDETGLERLNRLREQVYKAFDMHAQNMLTFQDKTLNTVL